MKYGISIAPSIVISKDASLLRVTYIVPPYGDIILIDEFKVSYSIVIRPGLLADLPDSKFPLFFQMALSLWALILN